ncbi:unnamed protein product [Microthlaspi erraticum]|uniref:HAT C-terminal dimerisation domain-containing protein n=1 Tax=Microthlaspi erraticum TaxID=1685480 RepID=A0A6D2JDR2_9BRAS|nr:unnamed protein product [Microthlaspi erraticum]
MASNINLLSATSGPDEELRLKALSMLGKLNKYWNPFDKRVEMNRLVMVAGVFDPSKKMKCVKGFFEKLYEKGSHEAVHLNGEIFAILKKLFGEYDSALNKKGSDESGASKQSNITSSRSSQFAEEVSKKTVLGNGLQYERMNDIYNELIKEECFQEKLNELDLYLKEDVENPKTMYGTEYDVLSWWKVNSGKFPVLSVIARDILAMQVSSVASESAFSTSGRVLDPSRSCLTHYMIEVLMCTEQWLKCELKLNERGIIRKEQLQADVELQD